MSDTTPLTILGAPDAEVCVDDACLLSTLLVEEIAEGDRLETSNS